MRLRSLTCSVASLVYMAVIATPAYAVDGVVLINQAAALNGNVTPGDAPGFPVEITQPGTYRLSSNLTVPDADTTAILIFARDVTLDLNGFSIIGPNTCHLDQVPAGPVTCDFQGRGVGISSDFANNTSVFNGTIRGMGSDAINISGVFGEPSVERIRAINNGGNGIVANAGLVDRCIVTLNHGAGISAASVTNSMAFQNGGVGIGVIEGIALANTVRFNGQQGVFASCPSTVVSNAATTNAGGDIFTSGSGCVRANNTPAP